jgi:hypothetical protein
MVAALYLYFSFWTGDSGENSGPLVPHLEKQL